MIYFTADTHFCHSNIIGSCQRPFNDVSEMNVQIINNWNTMITNHDDIYILGDFMYKGDPKEANDILSKLKGKKYLVKGNHEKYLENPHFKPGVFEWVKDYFVLSYKGMDIVLFHFPIFQWHKSHKGSIHLYGHIHNRAIRIPEFGENIKVLGPKAINVGVDVNDFYPVSIEQILGKIKGDSMEKDNEQ